MVKRLIAVLTALVMAACTAAPVYADVNVIQGVTITFEADAETAEIGENGGKENTEDSDAKAEGEADADKNSAASGTAEGENAEDSQELSDTDGSNGDSQESAAKDEENTDDEDGKDDTEDKDKTTTSKKETKKVSKYQKGLAAYIRSKNKNLSKDWSITLAGYFLTIGDKYDVPPTILMALARRESNFRAKAKSVYGYKGMMQCSDAFARSNGYKPSDLYNAKVSIEIAAKYLRTMKKKYGTYTKALSCYICGSGAVARGTYSKKPAWAVMNIRDGIKDYLKEHGYTD